MQQGVPEDYLDAVWCDGELATVKRLLQTAGVLLLTPPAGWLPADQRLRSLHRPRTAAGVSFSRVCRTAA